MLITKHVSSTTGKDHLFQKAEGMDLAVATKNTDTSQDQITAQAMPFKAKAVGGPLLSDHKPLRPGGELSVPPAGMDPL